MTRILVVDDEPQVLRALTIDLRARRHEVRAVANGERAVRQVAAWHPDVVILDLGLPDLDGIGVITDLRGRTQVPIIVVSGRTDTQDKVDAFDAGADDYIVKPFSVDELLARIRAITRRGRLDTSSPIVTIGEHHVDLIAKTVTREDESIHLTPTEWRILEALVRSPGTLIGRRELLSEVWDDNHTSETQYLRVYLNSLRRKLEPNPSRPRYLITEPGMGYRFEP
jgi:two-component system, OmpR family, KDP operon response regulator KdpE